jgi:hypothetical protein
MWLIKFKDTDPDTGKTSQEMVLAQSENSFHAEMIIAALTNSDEEPNRTYFAIKISNDNDKS